VLPVLKDDGQAEITNEIVPTAVVLAELRVVLQALQVEF
jgi:hypothetical protein